MEKPKDKILLGTVTGSQPHHIYSRQPNRNIDHMKPLQSISPLQVDGLRTQPKSIKKLRAAVL